MWSFQAGLGDLYECFVLQYVDAGDDVVERVERGERNGPRGTREALEAVLR